MVDIKTGKALSRRDLLKYASITIGCGALDACGEQFWMPRNDWCKTNVVGSANGGVTRGMMRGVGARQAAMFGGGSEIIPAVWFFSPCYFDSGITIKVGVSLKCVLRYYSKTVPSRESSKAGYFLALHAGLANTRFGFGINTAGNSWLSICNTGYPETRFSSFPYPEKKLNTAIISGDIASAKFSVVNNGDAIFDISNGWVGGNAVNRPIYIGGYRFYNTVAGDNFLFDWGLVGIDFYEDGVMVKSFVPKKNGDSALLTETISGVDYNPSAPANVCFVENINDDGVVL